MKVWIDTTTGTWGEYDASLVIYEVDDKELAYLDQASDSEISDLGLAACDLGECHHQTPLLADVGLWCVGPDLDGQLCVYTNVYEEV